MGWMQRAIDAGGASRHSMDDIEGGLFISSGDRRAKLSQFWVLMVLSSVIAAGGIIGDSTPAVIGAMIVAPLATPIYGMALATVTGARAALFASLRLLVLGIAVNVLIGFLIGMLVVHTLPAETNPQIVGRTAPTLLDLLIAVAVGVAGSFALVRRDISNILAGVAIAISLVPVLAVVGITLGSGHYDLALGAFVLFLTNVAAIIVAGVFVFAAAGYNRTAVARGRHPRRRALLVIWVFVVLLVVPLSAATVRTVAYELWTRRSEAAAGSWASAGGRDVRSVQLTGDAIVITVLGAGDAAAIEDLRKAVREKVPGNVDVRLIEETGTTHDL